MGEDIDRAFGFLIHDISTMLRSRFNGLAREAGLTGDQWLLISNLSRCNKISQRELARLADMTPPGGDPSTGYPGRAELGQEERR